MLIFTRDGDGWVWVPGPQLFREVNRGYKALNTSQLDYWDGQLGEGGIEAMERLRQVLEAGGEVPDEDA